MGYYESAWKDRKSFLFSSMLIGAVLAIAFAVFMAFNLTEGYSFFENVMGVIGVALIGFVVFSALVAVGRLVFFKNAAGGNFATNFVNGVWLTIVSMITGGWFGLVIGLLLCFVFLWLFAIVVIGYAVYLPISSIYLFIRYKKEVV